MTEIVKQIAEFILRNQKFLLSAHARPDGDSLGSQLALAEALTRLGKTVKIINRDPVPRIYASLPRVDSILISSASAGTYDGLIVLESSNLERTGVSGLHGRCIINIDHHPKNDYFGDINWVDPSAAAVGEMIFELLKELEVELTQDMATNLYAALLTDTGSFQFANTRHETFQIAADLVSVGADSAEIARAVYMNQPLSRLRLLTKVLSSIEIDKTGRIAWITLTRKILEETAASANDTEGIVNYALSVNGVSVCAFFREEGKDFYRVSLRSKGEEDVGKVAEFFGGGGHRNAAGLSVSGPYKEVCEKVLAQLNKALI